MESIPKIKEDRASAPKEEDDGNGDGGKASVEAKCLPR